MNVKGKYLKDESGSVISPVVDTKSIYQKNKSLYDIVYNLTEPITIYSNSSAGVDNAISFNTNFTSQPSKFTGCKLMMECRVGSPAEDFLEFIYGPIKYVSGKKFAITTAANIVSGYIMLYSHYCQFTSSGISNVNNSMINFRVENTDYGVGNTSNISITKIEAYLPITY